mmetsp:Transcript_85473/g.222667  ORF Transcript_85473/g.222667 Transcript_85473/m.222667 type:complete len:418 (+) Transcript_85473:259-1512(+)
MPGHEGPTIGRHGVVAAVDGGFATQPAFVAGQLWDHGLQSADAQLRVHVQEGVQRHVGFLRYTDVPMQMLPQQEDAPVASRPEVLPSRLRPDPGRRVDDAALGGVVQLEEALSRLIVLIQSHPVAPHHEGSFILRDDAQMVVQDDLGVHLVLEGQRVLRGKKRLDRRGPGTSRVHEGVALHGHIPSGRLRPGHVHTRNGATVRGAVEARNGAAEHASGTTICTLLRQPQHDLAQALGIHPAAAPGVEHHPSLLGDEGEDRPYELGAVDQVEAREPGLPEAAGGAAHVALQAAAVPADLTGAERRRSLRKALKGLGPVGRGRQEGVASSVQADLVLLARQLLEDVYGPRHEGHERGVREEVPVAFCRVLARRCQRRPRIHQRHAGAVTGEVHRRAYARDATARDDDLRGTAAAATAAP